MIAGLAQTSLCSPEAAAFDTEFPSATKLAAWVCWTQPGPWSLVPSCVVEAKQIKRDRCCRLIATIHLAAQELQSSISGFEP